jgi:hypothetical protein
MGRSPALGVIGSIPVFVFVGFPAINERSEPNLMSPSPVSSLCITVDNFHKFVEIVLVLGDCKINGHH